jgi:hypothetical protein
MRKNMIEYLRIDAKRDIVSFVEDYLFENYRFVSWPQKESKIDGVHHIERIAKFENEKKTMLLEYSTMLVIPDNQPRYYQYPTLAVEADQVRDLNELKNDLQKRIEKYEEIMDRALRHI